MTQESLATLCAADLSPELLARAAVGIEAIASHFVASFEKALPAVHRIADAVQALEDSPSVPGYEEQLRKGEDHPLAAKAMAYQIVRMGEERLSDVEAGRIIAGAIRRLLQVEKGSGLVVSRRAREMQDALANPIAKKALEQTCEQAGDVNAIYSIERFLNGAIEKRPASREALLAICWKLKPYLPDPRGRSRRLISATHEVFLEVAGRAYTHDPVNDDFVDPATRATRIAFSDPKFDPRPAHRRLNKRAPRSPNRVPASNAREFTSAKIWRVP